MIRWLRPVTPGITSMIRLDHHHVMAAFHQVHPGMPAGRKEALVRSACLALEVHTQLEEELFYPALQALTEPLEVIEKSFPEQAEMRRLIAQLSGTNASDPAYDKLLMELMRDVMHHVADEETTLLPAAERLLPEDELKDLGARMTRRRLELLLPRASELTWAALRSLPESGLVTAHVAVAATSQFLGRGGPFSSR